MIDSSEIPDSALAGSLQNFLVLAPRKIDRLIRKWGDADSAPVHSWQGSYRDRPWTDWTRGFLYGSSLLYSEISGEKHYSDLVSALIRKHMPVHLSHAGVHDHGFNNVSTYGNALRMKKKGLYYDEDEETLRLALRVSGAVQAMRFTQLPEHLGYIYSFHGPHSLFADTIRSLRSLALAHQLGQVLLGENEQSINLLQRLLVHAETTARFLVSYGRGRDRYDESGRVAHEGIFNTANGQFRSTATQQGYSAYSTWTRALAWIMLGYTELAEYIAECVGSEEIETLELPYFPNKASVLQRFVEVALICSNFYMHNSTPSGIPFWDTAAPGLYEGALQKDWEPCQAPEALDSSAAAIAAQALFRLGESPLFGMASRQLITKEERNNYRQAARRITLTLFSEPYLASENCEGLILHSVYHIPKGWDYTPPGAVSPCGESTMWGDYHALELALILSETQAGRYYRFYGQEPCRHFE